ncbi:U3 small nucleolar ribonucleoprotein protein IMP4 [Chiloscyllium plagiosum]|uniref:U3 small nucleolar ribonucleoprotein protein IMP4 n=1 Tax=Chiloscyllium plagiosum TaxID=36176 RepID=UPI001CB8440F|nr:U3 small nucleolar ribonucleoprotein protein IMP4 [Chiloscyllium plagiosum]
MLRREARMRREYLYRKAQEDKLRSIEEKKQKLKYALEEPPDGLVVCHLPFGPTAYFTLANVVMRHDIPKIGTMSEAYPHLIFHNLTSKLGLRVTSILKYLFPVPKEDSKRVITFANQDDFISFRRPQYTPSNVIWLFGLTSRFNWAAV